MQTTETKGRITQSVSHMQSNGIQSQRHLGRVQDGPPGDSPALLQMGGSSHNLVCVMEQGDKTEIEQGSAGSFSCYELFITYVKQSS